MKEQMFLFQKANEIITALNALPAVKRCSICGSLAEGTYDDLSDIDIEVDVSGHDNGQFMLELSQLLKDVISIVYTDYATSLIPNKYVVSIGIDEKNPFHIVDLCCTAQPHCTTVTQQQARKLNHPVTHILKLWTANVKHYKRGANCHHDIVRMGRKLQIQQLDSMKDDEILEKTLEWLEGNTSVHLRGLVHACREQYLKLIG